MEAGDLIYIPASVSMCGMDENGVPAHRSICTEKPAVVLVVARSEGNWLTVAMDGRLWGVRPDQGVLYQKGGKSK